MNLSSEGAHELSWSIPFGSDYGHIITLPAFHSSANGDQAHTSLASISWNAFIGDNTINEDNADGGWSDRARAKDFNGRRPIEKTGQGFEGGNNKSMHYVNSSAMIQHEGLSAFVDEDGPPFSSQYLFVGAPSTVENLHDRSQNRNSSPEQPKPNQSGYEFHDSGRSSTPTNEYAVARHGASTSGDMASQASRPETRRSSTPTNEYAVARHGASSSNGFHEEYDIAKHGTHIRSSLSCVYVTKFKRPGTEMIAAEREANVKDTLAVGLGDIGNANGEFDGTYNNIHIPS